MIILNIFRKLGPARRLLHLNLESAHCQNLADILFIGCSTIAAAGVFFYIRSKYENNLFSPIYFNAIFLL
jgi:hypothetical protein